MLSESHIPATGKGPGLASSIPSDLAISLGTKKLWGPPARPEDSSSPSYWSDTLLSTGLGTGKAGGGREASR